MTKLSLDIFMLFFFLWLTKRYVQPYDIVIIVSLKCHYHCSVTLAPWPCVIEVWVAAGVWEGSVVVRITLIQAKRKREAKHLVGQVNEWEACVTELVCASCKLC